MIAHTDRQSKTEIIANEKRWIHLDKVEQQYYNSEWIDSCMFVDLNPHLLHSTIHIVLHRVRR